jgi:hypothetical protein
MARFPYVCHTDPRIHLQFTKHTFYPLLKVGLFRDSKSILVESYIDTGSQWCVFNHAIARHLGIRNFRDAKYKVTLHGVGGKKPENKAYFHNATVRIYKNKRINLKKYWEVDTKIGFLEKEIDCAGILGVYGFLDHFAFQANLSEGYFEITPSENERMV